MTWFQPAVRRSPLAWARLGAGAATFVAIGACTSCSSVAQLDTPNGDTPVPSAVLHPTYYRDVEPILNTHCVDCHLPGGAAPFSLTSYEQARVLATSIASVTREQRMPPWPAVSDGDCPPQVGARRLDASDIALIGAWSNDGAPEGEMPAVLPALPRAWGALEHVDATLQSDSVYTPQVGTDDHRCFIVHPDNAQDRYLTAYAVHQDAPGIIHHIQLWAIDSDDAERQVDQLDAADDGPGYACPDDIGIDARYVSVWAPSDPIRRHPPDTGMLLTGGHRMVLQFHYHDHGQGLSDRTAIDLELAEHVNHPASMWAVSTFDIDLQPGQKSVGVSAQATVGGTKPYRLWGVRGHMHSLGSSVRVSLRSESADQCLLSIPRWDAAWQLMYFYETPMQLPIGSEVDVSCSYDTLGQTAPVTYGISTTDEMCFAYLYVTQD